MGRESRFLLLFVLLALGCGAEPPQPLSPLPLRLGITATAPLSPLEAPASEAARSFLVDGVVERVLADGRSELSVVLDGQLDPTRSVRWTARGAQLESTLGTTVTARLSGPWSAQVELLVGGRVLDSVRGRGGQLAPLAVGAVDSVLTADSPPPGWSLELREGSSLTGLSAGETSWMRWVSTSGAAGPWSAASAGSLPQAEGSISLSPLACGVLDFPRRAAGGGHLTCSQPPEGQEPRVDRWLAEGSEQPKPLVDPNRGSRGLIVEGLRPGSATVAPSLDGALIWAEGELGSWLPGSVEARPLRVEGRRGIPAASSQHTAFARADRVEVGLRGGSQRYLVPAQPLDTRHVVSLWDSWLAVLEGPLGGEGLRLHDHARHRGIVIPAPGARTPLLAGPWLTWVDPAGLHGVPVSGGRSWTALLSAASAAPEGFDDWLVLSPRGGGLQAVHVLTGQAVSLAQGPELVTPRGCSAGRATTWSRAPGTVGELQAWEARWRVFEEGGPSSSGAPLQLEAGGHGGRHGVLRTAGAEHHLHIDPGTGRTSLELWIGPGAEASLASLRVKHGARSLRIEVPAEATPPDGFGRWLVVGSLDSAPSTPPAERSLHLTWSASPEGTVIDAVRISREGPRQ